MATHTHVVSVGHLSHELALSSQEYAMILTALEQRYQTMKKKKSWRAKQYELLIKQIGDGQPIMPTTEPTDTNTHEPPYSE